METITEMPLIGWIMIAVFILVVMAFVVISLARKGREYGLRFFLSFQFILLFLIATTTYFGGIAPFHMEIEEPDVVALQNLQWGAAGYAAATILAAVLNSIKSNPMFGIIYTLAQSVVALLSALVIVYWIVNRKMQTRRIARY